jgi:uncharacterized protein (DUF2336 family)
MSVPASLLPELDQVVQHSSAEKRAKTLRRVIGFFLDRAGAFNAEQIALFDDVIGRLIKEADVKALAEMARRLAPAPNAPTGVLLTLAGNDDIAVAGPVLQQARLDDPDLKTIAETKSQAHLLALSTRLGVSEGLSEVLVERGNGEVLRSLAANPKARLSENAFTTLIKRAERDDVLAETVGLRNDVPPRLFRQLLMQARDMVQKRLLARAKPETQAEIRRVLAKANDAATAKPAPRKQNKLTEADVAEFAKTGKYDETIAALATICTVPVEVVDRLINAERMDPVLILARAAGFGWPTVRAIISARPAAKPSSQMLDAASENFAQLTAATAQRVVRFWQVRQGVGE